MANPLYLSANLHDGPNTSQILIPYVAALPVRPTNHQALILQADAQSFVAGMYYWQEWTWTLSMPLEAVTLANTQGDVVDIYINVNSDQTLPGNVSLYRNGQLQPGSEMLQGSDIWVAATQAQGPGELVPATTTRLGGVIVPLAGGLTVDAQGNIAVSSQILSSIDGKIGVVNSGGLGISMIQAQASGVVTLKSIQAGDNIAIVEDGNGTLTISSTGGGLSQVELTGDVVGTGAGLVPTSLSLTGVAAGTYTKVTVDTKGRVLSGQNPTTLAGFGIVDALPLTGGSMTGPITMTSGQTVTGIPDPVFPSDAVNLQSLNAAIAGAANGVNWRAAVDAATTGNITLSGLQTIDGVALAAGQRCLVKDQTDAKQNGLYVVASGAWARSADANASSEIWKAAVLVLGGTVNGLTQWTNTNTTAPVIGTDNITWGQLKGASNVYAAGAGLALTGLTFSIAPTGVTAGTWTKVTVNTLGQVTAASNLTPAELAAALGYTPVNRSGDTMQGALNFAPSIAVGAGAITNLASLATNDVSVNGVASIQSFGTLPAGSHRTVTFGGGQTLVYNAAAMILPSGANIVTQAGDVAEFVSLGSGNWQCDYYTRANGTALVASSAPDPTKLPLAGGTMTGAINEANFVQLSAAATTDIGAAASNNVQINAGATITSFGTIAAGARRALVFNAAVQITHNATSLILPGAANITTAIGDIAEFVSIGAGNWRCEYYTKANGTAVVASSAPDATKLPLAGGTMTGAINEATVVDVASAASPNIGTAGANTVRITGTTTITGFAGGAAGMVRRLFFASSLTLTNGTSLILPGGANIVTAAGDFAEFFYNAPTSAWYCSSYSKANGQSVSPSPGTDPTKLPLAGGTMTGSISFGSTGLAINYAPRNGAGTVNPFPAGAQGNVTYFVSNYTTTPLTGFTGGTDGMTRKFYVQPGFTVNMTHNASSFILPGGADIVATGGDSFEFVCINASPQQWKCLWFQRANGQALVSGGGSPFSSIQVFNGNTTTDLAMRIKNAAEAVVVNASAPISSTNFDVASGAVQYWTSAATVAWNLNIRHSSTTALNTVMAIGDSVTVVMMVTNGATAFLTNSVLIDGVSVTPKWQGGTAPSAGNANSIDVYSYTIIKTGSAAFTVLAAQTQYK